MDSRYDHTAHEDKIYAKWLERDLFNPDSYPAANKSKPFTIIMPPPNANDPLHIGHAMFVALEDVMIRFHRMLGDDTLWLPGTDHAGIETQFVFEKKLAKQGKSRFNYSRRELYDMINLYVKENSEIALSQMKKLGASADWSRFHFMLEDGIVQTVINNFLKLHQDGMVYRDKKLVNYCTKCGTSFSELEVNYIDQKVPFYYMKYGPFTLGTTRPETKFGDTAVAVHPDDKRYQEYVGQEIEVEGLNGKFKVKVIADTYVDPEFGTGVVKITPYHDFNDYEVWQRHKEELPLPHQVIGYDGKLNQHTGPYQGLKVKAAREKIAADLNERGLMDKVDENYQTRIATCYRCGSVIEPLPIPQFFVKVKPLTQPILKKIESGQLQIMGAGYDKILTHWLHTLKDWNISRQIVWGIRIPAWYSLEGNEEKITVSYIDPSGTYTTSNVKQALQTHQLSKIERGLQQIRANEDVPYILSQLRPVDGTYLPETDTFDTWFSSAQWPYSTLQNSEKGDFERFYPTSVMETAYDILPFWVMRMLLMGHNATGSLPFSTVYLHGLIRDEKGQKMSKSKGNVINPLEIVEEYGADALRMALVIRSTPGIDKAVGKGDFKAARNLTNKLWNAARYVLGTTDDQPLPLDQELLNHTNQLVEELTKLMSEHKLGLAADRLYDEFWHQFCDVYIEKHKSQQISGQALALALSKYLKLFHPFMPFITEALWAELPDQLRGDKLLIESKW